MFTIIYDISTIISTTKWWFEKEDGELMLILFTITSTTNWWSEEEGKVEVESWWLEATCCAPAPSQLSLCSTVHSSHSYLLYTQLLHVSQFTVHSSHSYLIYTELLHFIAESLLHTVCRVCSTVPQFYAQCRVLRTELVQNAIYYSMYRASVEGYVAV